MPPEDALSGEAVEEIVRTAARVHANPEILEAIRKAGTSCMRWGAALQSLFVDDMLDPVYFRNKPGKMIQQQHWDKLKLELRDGKAVFSHVNMPGSTDHVFTIVGNGGDAYVLHAWQDHHGLRAEPSMPIEKMIGLLKKLTQYEYTTSRNIGRIREVRGQLWGEDHMGPNENLRGASGRKRISFSLIASGKPKKPLMESKKVLGQLTRDLAKWQSESSRLSSATASEELLSAELDPSVADIADETIGTSEGAVNVKFAVGFGAALGFVFGAGGALYNHADWDEALEEGVKTGVAMGAGEGLGAVFGGSVIRSNVIAGAAFFGVITLWDVAHWAAHDISGVQLRQKLAQGAAGTVGGVASGIAAGAAGGALLGPVGALFGGLFGGVAGGIGGAAAGKALDEALWDEGEDSVMNAYDFFGWYNVKRGTRPTRSPSQVRGAYQWKVRRKPTKNLTDTEWSTTCTAHLMILLRAMFPEFKTMLKISKDIHDNKGKGVSVISNTMYSNFSVPPGTEELARPRRNVLSTIRKHCSCFCLYCWAIICCCGCCCCR